MPEIARAFLNARQVHTWVESQKGRPAPVEVTRKGAPCGSAPLSVVVDGRAVADVDHEDDERALVHAIDDAVVPHP
jgi:hypothetical protein